MDIIIQAYGTMIIDMRCVGMNMAGTKAIG